MAAYVGEESVENIYMKEDIINALGRVPSERKGIVHAQQFEEVIRSLGLEFGHPVVDEVMLGCKQDHDGFVDYTRFVEDFRDKMALQQREGRPTPPRPQQPAPAAPSPEVLAGSVQQAVRDAVNRERFGDTPQKKVVNQHATTIADLYSQFDNGLCNVDAFRDSLLQLGVTETPALARLLRTTPCEFKYKDLMNALKSAGSTLSDRNRVAGARFDRADGSILSDKPRSPGGRSPVRGAAKLGVNYSGIDVVTWRNDSGDAASRPGSTQLFSSKARGEFYKPDNRSNSVKAALFRDQYNPASTWASATQRQQHEGLGRDPVVGRANVGGKVTAMRDALYSAVRELDRGTISTEQFYGRMDAIGVEMPVQMQRLVAKQKANGSAVFRECVQAMTPIFERMERDEAAYYSAQELVQEPEVPDVTRERFPSSVSGVGQSDISEQNKQKAVKSHGDILTWTHAPNDHEVRSQTHGLAGNFPRKRSNNTPREHMRATGSFVEWDDAVADSAKHGGKSHRPKDTRDPMASSGNIISWHKDLDGAPVDVPKSARMAQDKLFGGGTPYGTDDDVAANPVPRTSYQQSGPAFVANGVGQISSRSRRKANVEARHATQSGTWFMPQTSEQPVSAPGSARRRPTPFGTDADL
jgi:hypothetical protein